MGDRILLLFVLLLSTVNGKESTTETSKSETVVLNSVEQSKPITSQESHSTIQYSVNEPDDGKSKTDNLNNGKPITEAPDDDIIIIEDILNDAIKKSFSENKTGFGDDTGFNYFPNNREEEEESILASNSNKNEMRHPSEIPEFGELSTHSETKENPEYSLSSSTPYESVNNPLTRKTANSESSPVLELTQGGYQKLFQPTDEYSDRTQGGLGSESAAQQGEAIRTQNDAERFGRARMSPQVPYRSPFQLPFRYTPGPYFHNPFSQPLTVLQSPHGPYQNSFYNTQPDFSQGQYSQLDNNGEFPHFAMHSAPRTPLQSLGYLFQSPFQLPVSQSVPINTPRQVPAVFSSGGSSSYNNYDSGMSLPGSEFSSPTFGNSVPSNVQFQSNSNPFESNANFERDVFANPGLNIMSNYPDSNEGEQFSPRFIDYPLTEGQLSTENQNPQLPSSESSKNEEIEQNKENIDETLKGDNIVAPFGTRIQKQNNLRNRNGFERQDNVYIRYPLTEAGYATEENLPLQNTTERKNNESDSVFQPSFPFFTAPRRYNSFSGIDPYRGALENVQRSYPNGITRNNENKNDTGESKPETMPLRPEQFQPETAGQIFRRYPERNPELSIPEAPFYVNPNSNPFGPIPLFPENHYQFSPIPPRVRESNRIPSCAEKSNGSFCFEDPEYPRGEIRYALNSDSFLMDRLIMPEQQLDGIPLVEQNTTETPQSEDNYICKSDIKYGLPARALNIRGQWKVIVNMKKTLGEGKFDQPIRMETCREAGNPCSFTQIKTMCVQKYSLLRLLSWSPEKGVHNDVYKIPIACSCQIVETKAT